MTATQDLSPRPAAATSRGSLLRSELGRLRHRRLVSALVLLGLLGVLTVMTAVFVTHDTDVAGAHATARAQAAQANEEQRAFEQQCRDDPGIPQADKVAGACDYGTVTEDVFFTDPRFTAAEGLPLVLIGVGVGGALLAALLAATAAGADWSSRSIVTLLSWHPRRTRFFATRLLAVCAYVAGIGVVAQSLALGLGALTVQLRGTWQRTPSVGSVGNGPDVGPDRGGMLPADRFWPELLTLQLRTVVVMVLVAAMAVALATVFRGTAGVLGVAFGWFAVVEVAVHALFGQHLVVRYMLTDNLTAALLPGGTDVYIGQQVTPDGVTPTLVHLSNGVGLVYLAAVALALCAVALMLLRRRDL